MKPSTILRIHSIISSALDLAARYDWADRNVAENASPDQAARLLNLVWTEDEEFGLYLWTAFTTGARRGKVSALRENRFDFARQQVRLARNYLVKQGQHIEKAPKDGEGRVLSLDLLTCKLFQERFQRRRAEARALGVQVPEDAFAFSPNPAGREPWNPDTMTHRYRRYARRVGITSSLKELRHYSATQLLAAGTDLNTVAGRLGHAEGSTTLKFYAQFTRPADQAAAIPPSSTAFARKNASASSTTITCRLPVATASQPSPRSSARKLGSKKTPLWRGSPSSKLRTSGVVRFDDFHTVLAEVVQRPVPVAG